MYSMLPCNCSPSYHTAIQTAGQTQSYAIALAKRLALLALTVCFQGKRLMKVKYGMCLLLALLPGSSAQP